MHMISHRIADRVKMGMSQFSHFATCTHDTTGLLSAGMSCTDKV